jgi:hypothetical protein
MSDILDDIWQRTKDEQNHQKALLKAKAIGQLIGFIGVAFVNGLILSFVLPYSILQLSIISLVLCSIITTAINTANISNKD